MTKVQSLQEVVASIDDGTLLALGGNALHRSPIGFVLQCIRQGVSNVSLIKTAGGLDVDVLAATQRLDRVYGGYIGFEQLGLAPHYRKAVERGEVEVKEHACASVIAGLRAAVYGVPFMPINGFQGSDLPALTKEVKTVRCPFTDEPIAAVAALRPDVAVLHVPIADTEGNAWIEGALYEDALMARAATRVIVTAEQIIDPTEWDVTPHIPSVLVDTVVHVPNGAAPGSCGSSYEIDVASIDRYVRDVETWLREEDVR